ncbi:hypothetical protein [Helcococcus massiliensis]|uniref:hypothetical protein n=1 Tax=Helcococcus massiliensis TaxID=2040290 RepID=UPI000CDE7A26|nr:hypothetical protein [Helcococcus massiliensis]
MKKKYLIYFVLILMLILSFFFLKSVKNQKILEINSNAVSEKEFLFFLNKQVQPVMQKFNNNENNLNNDFWTKEIDGVRPIDKLLEETIYSIKRFRATYEHAKSLGYVDKISFEDLDHRKTFENLARAEKIKKGHRVYGLSEFSTESYMTYEMDTFEKKYIEDNKENTNITDEDRLSYYEKNKDLIFKKTDDIKIDFIKIRQDYLSEEEMTLAEKELDKAYELLENGKHLKDYFSQNDSIKKYFYEKDINESNYSIMLKEDGDVLELAKDLSKSEHSNIVNKNDTFYLIEILDRKDNGYHSLAESKEYINKVLSEKEYEELIDEKLKDAEVKADKEKLYELIKNNLRI